MASVCPPLGFGGKYYTLTDGACVRDDSYFGGKAILNQGVGYAVVLGFGAFFAVFTSFLVSTRFFSLFLICFNISLMCLFLALLCFVSFLFTCAMRLIVVRPVGPLKNDGSIFRLKIKTILSSCVGIIFRRNFECLNITLVRKRN
jgi:hypothetical protein